MRAARALAHLLRLVWLRRATGSPLRALLTVFGVALGVATVVATVATNTAVLDGFGELAERAGGRADLDVAGDESGVDERLVDELAARTDLVAHAAGRIEQGTLLVGGAGSERVLAIGADFLGDTRFLAFDTAEGDDAFGDALALVNDPHTILVDDALARRERLHAGDTVRLRTARGLEPFHVAAVLRDTGRNAVFGGQVVVMYLEAAQRAFDRMGRVDRIDLALADRGSVEASRDRLQVIVGDRGRVERPGRRAEQVSRMTASFRVGLDVGAAVAVLVGMFLVWNAVGVAAAERRREIGVLRAIGATRAQVAAAFLVEAAAVGAVGGAAGVALGSVLARGVLAQFGANVSRFFENIAPPDARVPPSLALAGAAVGVCAALVAAWAPSRAAARNSPIEALRREAVSQDVPRIARSLVLAGALAAAAAGVLVVGAPWAALASVCLVLAAGVAATPAAIAWLTPPVSGAIARASSLGGAAAALGVANVPRQIARSTLAAGALLLALALGFTTAAYTRSYEAGCFEWVEESIPADVFVSAGSVLLDRDTVPFSPSWRATVAADPDVAAVDLVRTLSVPWRDLRLEVLWLDSRTYLGAIAGRAGHRVVDGPDAIPVDALAREPAALISENLAYRSGLRAGDAIELPSPTGTHRFRVAAVVVDYSSDQGWVMIDRRFALEDWGDDRIESLHVYVKRDASPERVAERLRSRLASTSGGGEGLFVTTAAEFKEEVRSVIRQTFGIARASEAVALAVAVLGVIGTMLAAVIDRARELGVLRAIGATRRQVALSVVAEAAWLAACAALVAAVVAVPASIVFVKVIGVQASGWRVPYRYPLDEVVRVAATVIALAAASAIYPAWRAARAPVTNAVAYE